MFTHELTLYRFILHFCRALTRDIPEDKLTHQPAPNVNNPYWILGHLAIATDYAAGMLGLKRACPAEWHRDFGPGSKPSDNPSNRVSKAELLAAIEAGHERVTAAIPRAEPASLSGPHPVEFMRDTPIKTVEDLLAHLMTTHPATHLGQLSMWRRLMGYPPLM